MTDLSYPYASGDLLENRNTYFYTPFGGQGFLHAWRDQRATALAACSTVQGTTEPPEDMAPVIQTLRQLKAMLQQEPILSAASKATLDHLLQRFEVSKRLHDDYTAAWKPVDTTRYHGIERYLLLAEILGQAATLTTDLRYLNGLLKCIDTLTASRVTAAQWGHRLRVVLDQERDLVERTTSRPPRRQSRATQLPPPPPLPDQPVTLQGIGLLASPTARSQAYIQALVAHRLHPEFVWLLGDHSKDTPMTYSPGRWQGLSLVDLNEPVLATCHRAGIPTHTIHASSINDVGALDALKQWRPDTLIYSGAGGQIVSAEALSMGTRFLHMHAGDIPDYRGSTTIYYALLNDEQPAVTAIFLDPQIDTGGILARHTYPIPDQHIDIDQIYDASIRADTLVRLLKKQTETGSFATPQLQELGYGTSYFVIHPILKHLAILSLPEHTNG